MWGNTTPATYNTIVRPCVRCCDLVLRGFKGLPSLGVPSHLLVVLHAGVRDLGLDLLTHGLEHVALFEGVGYGTARGVPV